jgi:hypothetical protein
MVRSGMLDGGTRSPGLFIYVTGSLSAPRGLQHDMNTILSVEGAETGNYLRN